MIEPRPRQSIPFTPWTPAPELRQQVYGPVPTNLGAYEVAERIGDFLNGRFNSLEPENRTANDPNLALNDASNTATHCRSIAVYVDGFARGLPQVGRGTLYNGARHYTSLLADRDTGEVITFNNQVPDLGPDRYPSTHAAAAANILSVMRHVPQGHAFLWRERSAPLPIAGFVRGYDVATSANPGEAPVDRGPDPAESHILMVGDTATRSLTTLWSLETLRRPPQYSRAFKIQKHRHQADVPNMGKRPQ